MNTTLRKDADQIIAASLKAVLPDEAVFRAPEGAGPFWWLPEKLHGRWQMPP